MKQTEPHLWNKVRWVILPHDYINLCLRTGIGSKCENGQDTNPALVLPGGTDPTTIIPTTDAGDASGTGLLHPETRSYIPEVAELIDTKYQVGLPKILPSYAISGYLSDEWKKIIDPDNKYPPIPISVGSGDNMMSALGCQCTSPGMAVLRYSECITKRIRMFGINTNIILDDILNLFLLFEQSRNIRNYIWCE